MTKARDLANAGTALTTVSATELGYLDGVTSAVQTQINSKIAQATAINPTIVDAKGDIVAASAADTPARLAVGSNGTVLTADSAESTGLKWSTPSSGGMTLINTGGTALSGTVTTVSSIPGTYNSLVIFVTDWYASSTNTPNLYFNSDSTASNYAYSGTRLYGSNLTGLIGEFNSSAIAYIGTPNSDQNNNLVITIPNYADTTANKIYTANAGIKDGSNNAITMTAHRWNNSAAITAVNFQTGAGTWSGGTIYVYGVK
jgi:hypothetical protein